MFTEGTSSPSLLHCGWDATPPQPVMLTGDEAIPGTGATTRDFWAWSLSDIRANTVRSMLAEYLVAAAMGAADRPRVEWDSCDVVVPQGRIEVKASAYLQAWSQRAPSRISFGGLTAKTWSPSAGYSSGTGYNADVYVFALLTATEHNAYDALNPAGWHFWVLPDIVLLQHGCRSISLSTLHNLAGEPIEYARLRQQIETALADRP